MTGVAGGPEAGGDREPSTTSGAIAVVNLHAQIDGLAATDRLALIDLLTRRGQVLGRIADYELAAELAEQLVRGSAADDGAGGDGAVSRAAARDRPGFTTLGALAVFHAERGEAAEAETLFDQARQRQHGTSPFPLASLDFRRGLMWHRQGNPPAARAWLEASRRRVPAYAPAVGHLGEIDLAEGDHQAAINRLWPLASVGDDPAYAAALARALSAAGHQREAGQWGSVAATRYDQLARRHPQAYAEHAADFRRLEPSLTEHRVIALH